MALLKLLLQYAQLSIPETNTDCAKEAVVNELSNTAGSDFC